MVDLHLHTNYSDGTLTPAKLVERAAKKGINIISVTDHDGINGIPEALEAGKKYGIRVIPGIELSCDLSNEEAGLKQGFVHILGYGIDIENDALNKAVAVIRRQREKRNANLANALKEIGYKISPEDLADTGGQDYLGKPNFALAMVKRGYIKTPKEAFTPGKYLRHPRVRSIRRKKIYAKDAISLIINAGGRAVLAHPLKIGCLDFGRKGYWERLDSLLEILQRWGLFGMECYYSTHTPKEAEMLVLTANRRDLFITCGSDYHGPGFDPAVDIGVTGCPANRHPFYRSFP
jgi:predicted metal-dependent phosphoesterase TrpH